MRRSLSDSMYYGYLLLLLFLHIGQVVQGSGFFELQILQISNSRGELANGACCGSAGSPVPRDRSLPCPRQCNTFFRVCLKEYQSNVTSTGSCSFGNTSSPVLGGNSFALADPDRSNGKLVLPFSFRWTRSFTLILQAVDYDNSTNPPSNHVIDEATYSGIILPSTTWHTLNCEGNTSRITYRVRVQCDLHYFNHTCTKFCRPRDDKFGHYVCDVNGDKECITGWRGTNCEIAECKKGCHPIHGKCDQPGGCECRPGWRGEFCDQCTPYPGCKHGYCNGSSWQCICDTNWGGILCDQDLNTCGSQEPCENGGTCENTAPDQYMCTCPEGFSGLNCNVVDNPCATAPCGNSGTCQVVNGQYHCTCAPGWTGKTCHDNIDECASAPCQNGGTCKDMVNSFHCICPSEWEGSACQFDADECLTNPCINAHSCHNLVGDYRCNCQEGWTGKNCDQNINDCIDRCQHGATCIDLVNDYHCACQPGYTGRDCHTDINECESNPCQNGGECSDQQNGYRCICPVGFLGERCEVENDHCTPNPCQNAAPCFNTQADYYCHCPEEWEGKNCSTPRINCDNPPCDVVDSCIEPQTGTTSLGTPELNKSGVCGDHGICVSLPSGGYKCSCDAGYMGKYCHENINDCQVNPCLNGGTCVDKINSFRCMCKDGWEGNTCNITKSHACRSDPCQNGATCVNKGDDYSCICKEGYEGQHCELDINDCSSAPCYNGGKCVDGVNWFLCECAEGFTGANCRINVNDCASNPCGFGSTCVDGIGEFRCICPPGRKGVRCEQVEETDIPRGECVWNGQRFARNSTVEDDCNICTCAHTGVKCTQVWCGLGNCLGSPNLMHGTVICHLNQVCVPSPREACLTPNCAPWGECRDLESGKRVGPPLLPAPPSCWPNQAELSNSCARLTLLLDRSKLPQGVSTEGLCVELRRLVAIHQSHTGGQDKLILLCDLKQGYNDTIEVTMSSLSTTSGSEENKAVTEGIRVLGELISRKQTNLSALMSIVEVNVDTALISEELPGNGYLIALICVILIILCVAGIGGLYYWHHYSRRRHGATGGALGASGPGPCHRHHDDEKSNNLQNEENLRRYANPLKDEVSPGLATSLGSIRGSTAKPSTAESAVDLQTPRVSVVRPLGSGESPAGEMLEMLAEPEVAPGKVVASSSSEPGLHPTHRNSQILLFKAQNPDVRKNTAAFDDTSAHKDFAKRIINLKVLPPVQRTLQPSQVDRGGEVLTVIV